MWQDVLHIFVAYSYFHSVFPLSFAVAFVAVLVLVSDLEEEDAPEVPALEDDGPGRLILLCCLPLKLAGLVGSSRLLDFFDSMTRTRCIFGRRFKSDWVQRRPMWMHKMT